MGGAPLPLLAQHACAVGLRLRIRAYPGPGVLRDAGQVALMRRLRVRLAGIGRWATEVPIPRPGDLRAFDAVVTMANGRCGIECIVRLHDCQAQLRAIHLKQRDAALECVVVVLVATHNNRRALAEAGGYLTEAFPLGTRRVVASLMAGRCPEANGVVVL